MPWKVEERDGQYCVVKLADGETVHCHSSREKATAQLRALYANEPVTAASDSGDTLDTMDHDLDPPDQADVVIEIIDQAVDRILDGDNGRALEILAEAASVLEPDPEVVTAAFAGVLDEPDTWLSTDEIPPTEDTLTSPASALADEAETAHMKRSTPERKRREVRLPEGYDGVRAAQEMGLRAAGFDETKHPRVQRGAKGGGQFTVKGNAAGRFEVVNEDTGKKVAETTDVEGAQAVADEKNSLSDAIFNSTDAQLAQNIEAYRNAPESQARTDVLAQANDEIARREEKSRVTVGDLKPGDVVVSQGLPGFTDPSVSTVTSVEPQEGQVMEDGSVEESTIVRFGEDSSLAADPNQKVLVVKPGLTPSEQATFDRIDAIRKREAAGPVAPMTKAVGAFPNGAEFHVIGDQVYRVPKGAPTDVNGLPMGARWESSLSHWETYKDAEGTVPFMATHPTLLSSAAPIAPPAEWFSDPGLEGPTPLTVTPEGRIYGHLGEWGKCHTGIGGRCVMIPRSGTGYADFHNGGLMLESGEEIRVGKITLDTGHAPLSAGASRAAAHYDHTGHVGAFVRAGEDEFGPWLAGAVRSDATPEQIRDLRANPPSGDWRKLQGRNGLELIAALAVPVQGFPVAALAASGDVMAFVSGWGDTGELALVASAEPEQMDREWRLLTARLDGIDGLAALVSSTFVEARHPRHPAGRHEGGKFAPKAGISSGQAQSQAVKAAATIQAQEPLPQREITRVEGDSMYGGSSFKKGQRVRTGEGHLGTVEGEAYSGSQVKVRREMDGVVENHDPHTLTREGPRAALPPREKGLTAAGVRITIEVDADEQPVIVADASLEREIGLRVEYFRDHGFWPEDQLAGASLTEEQFRNAIAASSLMIDMPAAPTSVELRQRLTGKGLLV